MKLAYNVQLMMIKQHTKGGVAIRPLFGPLCLEKIQVLNFKYLNSIFEYSICLLFKFIIDIKWFWILLLRGIYEDRYPNWFLSIFPIFGRFSVIFHQIFQIWTLKTLEYPKNFTYMFKLYKRAFHKQKIMWVLKCYSNWILERVNMGIMIFP